MQSLMNIHKKRLKIERDIESGKYEEVIQRAKEALKCDYLWN